MDLYVVRHAIAYERDDVRWPGDRERPLTEAGEERFRRVARGLRRIADNVDVVLCSPLTRAWQTATILTEEAGWPPPSLCDALEPDRKPSDMLHVLEESRHDAVAVVGHEPHLGELIAYLLTGSEDGARFELKKGGAARLELEELVPGRAAVRWLIPPKVARAVRG